MANVRYDWYQTESQVTLEVLLKNQKAEDVDVKFDTRNVKLKAKLASGEDYNLDLNLWHSINTDGCSHKILSTKIEIKMKKTEAIRWSSLEAAPNSAGEPAPKMVSIDEIPDVPKYPSSSTKKHDWDKIEKEIEKEIAAEKPEGEAAVNELFKQIYASGNDEVRKAMNKSFMESGGTVLSTNWKEVSQKKVDVKPPDGTEFKTF